VAVSVSTARQDGLATVTVIGELDLAAAEIVTQAIHQEITATGTRAVHIDLSGATDIVRQILSLTGVLEHLTAEATADPPG
jgi:aspartate oxidase